MKKFALLLPLLVACGSDDGVDNLGTLEQPIFLPSGYGFESNAGERCDSSWDGGACWVPDNTGDNVVLKVCFDVTSCTGFSGFMGDRIVEAMENWAPAIRNQGVTVNLSYADSSGCGLDINVRCGTNPTGSLGRFQARQSEAHSTPRGTLKQYKGGWVTIDEYQLFALPVFLHAPLQKQVNISRNTVLHELMHVSGIGHDAGNGYVGLMSKTFCIDDNNTCRNTAPWAVIQGIPAADLAAVDCYNATSGTGDRCAD